MSILLNFVLQLAIGAVVILPAVASGSLDSEMPRAPVVEVMTWKIRPVGKAPNEYWVDGVVRNVSRKVLTEVKLRFSIRTAQGNIIGESDAPIKLVTLLPGQTCLLAAPVEIHDRRMARIVLIGVKVDTADDVLMFRDVPFAARKKSDVFKNTAQPSRRKSVVPTR